jgi:hypothetical protein
MANSRYISSQPVWQIKTCSRTPGGSSLCLKPDKVLSSGKCAQPGELPSCPVYRRPFALHPLQDSPVTPLPWATV